jgi:hypothetical protein
VSRRVDGGARGRGEQGIEGLVETSPGVRSCMVEYDQRRLSLNKLLDILIKIEKTLPAVGPSPPPSPPLPTPPLPSPSPPGLADVVHGEGGECHSCCTFLIAIIVICST